MSEPQLTKCLNLCRIASSYKISWDCLALSAVIALGQGTARGNTLNSGLTLSMIVKVRGLILSGQTFESYFFDQGFCPSPVESAIARFNPCKSQMKKAVLRVVVKGSGEFMLGLVLVTICEMIFLVA